MPCKRKSLAVIVLCAINLAGTMYEHKVDPVGRVSGPDADC
jgi:hypothetical protein